MKKLLCLAALTALVGCGGGNSLTGSSSSKIPNVAGIYSGALHWDVNNSRFVDGSARITVNQSGSSVALTGTVTFEGSSSQLAPFQCQVDATGFVSACQGGSGNS